MKDGDWAWPLFKGSPDLWLHTFHSNPLDYVANPRATPKTPAPIDPVPDVTQDEPCFVDPASLKKANSAKRAPRILYDSLVHEQIFGTVLRRCDSEDNLFINPNNGQNNSDYMYRTKTYAEFVTNNQKYSPTSAQYKIYFERINEAQFALYYSERDFNAKNDNWTRMGLTFHEYYHLQVSRHEGDLTAHDSQGLLYQFERRVNQNKLGPADQRWTTDQITRGRHVCRSLLRCCALDSAYFRSDLFRLNYHNIDNLQSLGMDGIMATTKFVDAQRKEREHKVQYVLEKISKFSTLCPLAAERKNLRMILGFDDSLKSSDSLLSPVDASSILSSIQLLPKWPRVVFTLDSYHLGASIGQLMCTVFESQSEHQDTEIPVSVANTNSDSFGQSQISQSSTHRNFLAAAKSTQAPAVNYLATVQNLPAIPPANVNDIADVGALSTTDASSSVSTSEPSSVSTISEPAIAEDLVPALHGRLDMADNSENGIYFNPERFSTWLYLHHHAPESLPGSDRVSTVDSDGQSYEPLEAGCEPDPRSSLARSTYHPPMAPQSTLYDDYESDSGEDNRSFFSNASSKSSSSCVTEIITPDTDASSVPSRLTVSSFESMVIVPEDPNLVSDMLPDAVISSASSSESAGSLPEQPRSIQPPETTPADLAPPMQDPSTDLTRDLCPEAMFNHYMTESCQPGHFRTLVPTHAEHLKELSWLYFSRIIHRGSRREIFILAHTAPDNFFCHARCLEGLNAVQRRRIIGPFSERERRAFRERFYPTLTTFRRCNVRQTLAEMVIPDTSSEFSMHIQPSPALRYVHEQAKLSPIRARPFGVPKTPALAEPTIPVDEGWKYPDEDGQAAPADSVSLHSDRLSDYDSRRSDVSTKIAVDKDGNISKVATFNNVTGALQQRHQVWGPYFFQSEPELPAEATHEELLDLVARGMRNGPLQLDSTGQDEGKHTASDMPVLSWLLRQFHVNGDAEPCHPESIAEYQTLYALSQISPSVITAHRLPPNVDTMSFVEQDAPTVEATDIYLAELQSRPPSKMVTKRSLFSFALPQTTVPVIQRAFLNTNHGNQTQPAPIFHLTTVVHPAQPTLYQELFTLSLDGFHAFASREIANWEGRPRLPEQHFSLYDCLRLDPATNTSYFPAGTISKILQTFLFPRPASYGYRHLVHIQRGEAKENGVEVDALTAQYPQILSALRGNFHYPDFSDIQLRQYAFGARDRRFHVQDSLQNEMFRPQTIISTSTLLEPTFFPLTARRQWLLLRPDCDVHGWNHVSALALLLGRMEIIKKTLVYATTEEILRSVPGKTGVNHFRAARPGLNQAFFLSISAGGLRPEGSPTVMPKISPRWPLKLTARLITSLFCGCIQRVTLATAAAKGINADAYNKALEDHKDVSKFYKVTYTADGTPQRTRRFDVHCETFIGTHRPVYIKDSRGKEVLDHYERIIWPGFAFSHTVINMPKENKVITFDNKEVNARWGGPRVILARDTPIEEEEYEAMISVPYFYFAHWQKIYERARVNYPNREELRRQASFTDVLFRPDTIPPLWSQHIHRLQSYVGKNFYLGLENLLIAMELDDDVHTPYDSPLVNPELLTTLNPYATPHISPPSESILRVTRAGAVSYLSEESQQLRTMPDIIRHQRDLRVPPVSTNHSKFVAHTTAQYREEEQPDNPKVHSTLEFSRSLQYL